jgi:hypothetical protein
MNKVGESRWSNVKANVVAGFWVLVTILIFAAIFNNAATIGSWFGIQSKTLYSTQYTIPEADISIYDKPQDCDWSFAPLGNKGCHYELTVFSERWETQNGIVILKSKDERTGKTDITRYQPGEYLVTPPPPSERKDKLYVGWNRTTP